jgi:hypothetical protein
MNIGLTHEAQKPGFLLSLRAVTRLFVKNPVSLVGALEPEIYYMRFNLYEFTALQLLSGG